MSMSETAKLGLALVQPAQAQKHVTVNDAFQRLDALAQISIDTAGRRRIFSVVRVSRSARDGKRDGRYRRMPEPVGPHSQRAV